MNTNNTAVNNPNTFRNRITINYLSNTGHELSRSNIPPCDASPPHFLSGSCKHLESCDATPQKINYVVKSLQDSCPGFDNFDLLKKKNCRYCLLLPQR